MKHVIYNTKTKQLARVKGNGAGVIKNAVYATERAAKAGLTRMRNKVAVLVLAGKRLPSTLEDVSDYAILSIEDYNKLDTMVERTNYMTGKKFMEDINTPYSCSPSSESYWSN